MVDRGIVGVVRDGLRSVLLGKRRRLDLDRGDGGRREREREKALVLLCGCVSRQMLCMWRGERLRRTGEADMAE